MSHQDAVVDVAIVGGGIVGCSVALELARSRRFETIVLLEKEPFLGNATSTRNSYVIHAGIYYPPGSVKARLCVEGNRLLVGFCREHGIAHAVNGKLIVARSAEEVPILERLHRTGTENGAPGLEIVDEKAVRRHEPHVSAVAALRSPSTGVFDVGQWFRVVEAVLWEEGVVVLKGTTLVGLEPAGDLFRIRTSTRGEVLARHLVNSAGLHAGEVAGLLGNDHRIYPCRGDYFVVTNEKRHLVRGAVYPVPEPVGLGVHLTRLADGTLLVGPDARYIERKDDYSDLSVFRPDGSLDTAAPDVARFAESARTLLPALEAADLRLGHCGIRPRLVPPGEKGFRDFVIERDRRHPNAVHLVGIESPGLTACLAIAREVARILACEGSRKARTTRLRVVPGRRTKGNAGGTVARLPYSDAGALSERFGVPRIFLSELEIAQEAITALPAEIARRHRLMPVNRAGRTLVVAMADPTNIHAVDDLRFVTGLDIEVVVAPAEEISEAIERYFGSGK